MQWARSSPWWPGSSVSSPSCAAPASWLTPSQRSLRRRCWRHPRRGQHPDRAGRVLAARGGRNRLALPLGAPRRGDGANAHVHAGLGALFLSLIPEYAPEVYSLLFGEVLGISANQLLPTAALAAVSVISIGVLYRPLLLSSVSADMGEARGIGRGRIDFLVSDRGGNCHRDGVGGDRPLLRHRLPDRVLGRRDQRLQVLRRPALGRLAPAPVPGSRPPRLSGPDGRSVERGPVAGRLSGPRWA